MVSAGAVVVELRGDYHEGSFIGIFVFIQPCPTKKAGFWIFSMSDARPRIGGGPVRRRCAVGNGDGGVTWTAAAALLSARGRTRRCPDICRRSGLWRSPSAL
jgi:hypothetical protein